jgi:hypothetical protein
MENTIVSTILLLTILTLKNWNHLSNPNDVRKWWEKHLSLDSPGSKFLAVSHRVQ